MASLQLDGVGVQFPIYNSRSRSLKSMLFSRNVGGMLGTNSSEQVIVHALRDVTLSLATGSRLAIVGHNGSGKSTLLKVMSGIYEPVQGRVRIDGTVAPLTDIMLGMDAEATGYQNIIMRAVFLGMTVAEARSKIPEIEEFTGLGGYLDLPMRTYSSGMAVRLALAVSTCTQPDILLLDEMIGAGDASFLEKARKRIDDLIQQASILVIASHDLMLIRRLCPEAVLLSQGRIVERGPTEQVLEKYAAIR